MTRLSAVLKKGSGSYPIWLDLLKNGCLLRAGINSFVGLVDTELNFTCVSANSNQYGRTDETIMTYHIFTKRKLPA